MLTFLVPLLLVGLQTNTLSNVVGSIPIIPIDGAIDGAVIDGDIDGAVIDGAIDGAIDGIPIDGAIDGIPIDGAIDGSPFIDGFPIEKPDCTTVRCKRPECKRSQVPTHPHEGEGCCGVCQDPEEAKDTLVPAATSGTSCDPDKCRDVNCIDGFEPVIPDGECCLDCRPNCTGVTCIDLACDNGTKPVTNIGSCCPVCMPDCSAKACVVPECEDGRQPVFPPNECCPQCPRPACPEEECKRFCEFGRKSNAEHCPSCECALSPCQNVKCPFWRTCMVDQTDFANQVAVCPKRCGKFGQEGATCPTATGCVPIADAKEACAEKYELYEWSPRGCRCQELRNETTADTPFQVTLTVTMLDVTMEQFQDMRQAVEYALANQLAQRFQSTLSVEVAEVGGGVRITVVVTAPTGEGANEIVALYKKLTARGEEGEDGRFLVSKLTKLLRFSLSEHTLMADYSTAKMEAQASTVVKTVALEVTEVGAASGLAVSLFSLLAMAVGLHMTKL